jgi:hypothetical protein
MLCVSKIHFNIIHLYVSNVFAKLKQKKETAKIKFLPTAATGFEPVSGRVGFVVDKVGLAKVFFEYFSFPSQFPSSFIIWG